MKNLRDKGLTQGITITLKYQDRQGETYATERTINPLLLEGSGYFRVQGLRGRGAGPGGPGEGTGEDL